MTIPYTRFLGLLVLLPAAGLLAVDFGPVRTPGDLARAMQDGEFPAPDLIRAIQLADHVRLRRHAWNLFAGLTSQDERPLEAIGPKTPHANAPIFVTWYTKANVLNAPTEDKGRFGLELPQQVLFALHADSAGFNVASPVLKAPAVIVFDKVYFNTPAFQFIRDNQLNTTAGRLTLNCKLGAAVPEDRHIPSFPNTAVALKAMWRVVSKTKPTAVPVWDPESNSLQRDGNPPDGVFGNAAGRWSRYVAVVADQAPYAGREYTDVDVDDFKMRARVVPVSRFYNIPVTPGIVADVKDLTGLTPNPDDYLILVGMHVTTKELPNWFWATFWWHDQPDRGPYAGQRPSSVRDPWNNYLMNLSYDEIDPREPDRSPHIAFNPYLEAQQKGGVKSNCVTCHLQAAWPRQDPDFGSRIMSTADTRFQNRIRLDFLWSITGQNGESGSCPAPPH